MTRIVRDDSGERDGYWVGPFGHKEFVRPETMEAIQKKERRRAARIVKKFYEGDLRECADTVNEILGRKSK